MTVTFDLTDPTVRKNAKLFWYGLAIKTPQVVSIGDTVAVTTPWNDTWTGKVVRVRDMGGGWYSVFIEFDHMSSLQGNVMLYVPAASMDIKIDVRGFGSGKITSTLKYAWWFRPGRDVIIGSGNTILFTGKVQSVRDRVSEIEAKVVDRIQYYGNTTVVVEVSSGYRLTDILVEALRQVDEFKSIDISINQNLLSSPANITINEDTFIQGKLFQIISTILEVLNASVHDTGTAITIYPTGSITASAYNLSYVAFQNKDIDSNIINRAVVMGKKFSNVSNDDDAVRWGLAEYISAGTFDWSLLDNTAGIRDVYMGLKYGILTKYLDRVSILDYGKAVYETYTHETASISRVTPTNIITSEETGFIALDGLKAVYANLPVKVVVDGTAVTVSNIYLKAGSDLIPLGFEIASDEGITKTYRTLLQIPIYQYKSEGVYYFTRPEGMTLQVDIGTAGQYDIQLSSGGVEPALAPYQYKGIELVAPAYTGSGGSEVITVSIIAKPTLRTVTIRGDTFRPLVVYDWEEVNMVAVAEDSSSIAQYGVKQKVYDLSNIDISYDQLQQVASSIVNAYSHGRVILTGRTLLSNIGTVLGSGYVGHVYNVTDGRFGIHNQPLTLTEMRIKGTDIELTYAPHQTDLYQFWTNLNKLFELTRSPIQAQYFSKI